MKQVVKVRIVPTQQQAAALRATLGTCNEAASLLSAAMHAEPHGTHQDPSLQARAHD